MWEERKEIQIRESTILKKLRAGEVVNCVTVNTCSPRLVQMAGMIGFDCVWLDLEHSANDWTQVEYSILAAKAHGMDSFVRTPRGGYNNYIKPLELDATGIMVPHVMDADDARGIIRTTRFPPIGRRPIDSGNADGAFAMMNMKQYIENSNNNKFVIFQIEDYEAMDHLDEICSMEGVDIIFFGMNDFANSLGKAGEWFDPEVTKAKELVAKTARKYGKAASTTCPVDGMKDIIDMGFNFLGIACDIVSISEHWTATLDRFHETISDL